MLNPINKPKKHKKSQVIAQSDRQQDNMFQGIPNLTEEQIKRHTKAMERARAAKRQRDKRREEFDELTYEEDYYTNKQAANAYLRPKLNDDEVRVVTGTTEKKLEVLSNEVLSLNLQPEAVAYDDQDNEIVNLGQDMMDVVKRTNDIEKDEDFWQDFLQEMLRQRIAIGIDTSFTQHVDNKKQVIFRKDIISGLRVYFGDVNIPIRKFQDQPYIVIYSRKKWNEAETLYKNWSRWKYVKAKPGASSNFNAFGYRMNDISEDEIEELQILDPFNNEWEFSINGVPMFEEPTKLPYEVTQDRRYPIFVSHIKSTDTDFIYGKPPVASAKTLQALDDEMIRNIIRKWRQALEPPIGTKDGSNIYSKDIWMAGAVTQGISSDDFDILNPENRGVTQSEFNMVDFINKKTEEFIGAGSLQQGIAPTGEQTATEIQQLQRNAIKNLGHIVAAFMRAKRDSTYLRLYSVLENYKGAVQKRFNPITKEVESVFKRFTINNSIFENGARGKKIVQFTDKNITPEELNNIFEFEKKEEKLGRPTRIRFLNTKLLSSIPIFWHIVVNQQRREGSALDKAMFNDELQQAVGIQRITGRQINADKIIDEYEQRWQVRGFFQRKTQITPTLRENAEVSPDEAQDLTRQIRNQERTITASRLTEGVRGATQRPSVNEMQLRE